MRAGIVLVGLWLTAATSGPALAATEAISEIVSFSFDEGTVAQYELSHPNHVQDTIFAPKNHWAPQIRFLGGGNGSAIEVDAISYGSPDVFSHADAFFSVSRNSDGVPGSAVAGQEQNDREADIFASDFSNTNQQIYDANGSNGAPNVGLAEPASTNIDGLDMRAPPPGGEIYWSINRETAETENPYAPVISSGADIFFGLAADAYSINNPPQVYASAVELGLTETDDIDALVVIEVEKDGVFDPTVDTVYYSLVSHSTSLAFAGVPPFDTAGGADVFIVGSGSPMVGLAFSAESMGLLANDEIDAFDLAVRSDILAALASAAYYVPSGPAVAIGLALLLGAGTPWILARRRSVRPPRS